MALNDIRIILSASQTTTSSSNGNNLVLPGGFRSAFFHLHVSAASGTSPTLNVRLQNVCIPAATADTILNPPSGTAVFDDFASFTQATSTGDWLINYTTQGTSAGHVLADGSLAAGTCTVGPLPIQIRVKWTVAGTSPSFTWSVVAHLIP